MLVTRSCQMGVVATFRSDSHYVAVGEAQNRYPHRLHQNWKSELNDRVNNHNESLLEEVIMADVFEAMYVVPAVDAVHAGNPSSPLQLTM
jgi:hypothetical protein